VLGTLGLWEKVTVPPARAAEHGYLRIGEGRFVREAAVRRPLVVAAPEGLGPGERWLDVDLVSQTLIAWEGARPVFATLISTGIGRPGSRLATPVGLHRIRAKLRSTNMDNLEHTNVAGYYFVEDVPWVQWFSRGAALHGEFWHRRLGHVHSHGCVNLSPSDAALLFGFVKEGAVVRVR